MMRRKLIGVRIHVEDRGLLQGSIPTFFNKDCLTL